MQSLLMEAGDAFGSCSQAPARDKQNETRHFFYEKSDREEMFMSMDLSEWCKHPQHFKLAASSPTRQFRYCCRASFVII